MTFKFVSLAARLLGFVVSPLLTAPAAAAELERGVLVATLASDGPAAVHVVDLARCGAGAECGQDRLKL